MSEPYRFHEGAQCLLRVMDQQFWVRVTEVGEEAVRVSFPGHDYPLEGMTVELEVHEEDGYRIFKTRMTGRGANFDEGIILAFPMKQQQRVHRTTARVETNLPIEIKDTASTRKYSGVLTNLSQSGGQFITEGPFDFDSTIELALNLPGEPTHTLLGQVRHVDAERGSGQRTIGIRFISPDAESTAAVERYIVRLLREQYPSM